MIAQDGVMSEYAPKGVTVLYLSRGDLFDECTTKDDFQSKFKSISEEARDTKTLASMLRKCVKEVASMIKVPDLDSSPIWIHVIFMSGKSG